MTPITLLVRVSFLICVFAALAAVSLAQDGGWQKFAPADGTFSAQVPCKPELESETDESPLNDHRQYKCNSSSMVVVLAELKGLDLSGDQKAKMDLFSKKFMEGFGGTLVSQKDIVLDKHRGRELIVKIVIKEYELSGKVRIYFAGTTVYAAAALILPANAASPDVDRFLDSFTIK